MTSGFEKEEEEEDVQLPKLGEECAELTDGGTGMKGAPGRR